MLVKRNKFKDKNHFVTWFKMPTENEVCSKSSKKKRHNHTAQQQRDKFNNLLKIYIHKKPKMDALMGDRLY